MKSRINLIILLVVLNSVWSLDASSPNEDVSRDKRQAPTPPPRKEQWHHNDRDGLLVTFREVKLNVFHREEKHSANFTEATASVNKNTSDPNTLNLTLSFPSARQGLTTTKFELTLKIVKSGGYYSMKTGSVSLEGSDTQSFKFTNERISSSVDLIAPETESFHCSRFGSLYPTVRLENQTFTIDIIGFQFQAFQPAATEKFQDAYECVGFFTPGIWMGISVTIILISILTWGMKMIMDVKTMDRFDDPKGKPISFGSGD